MIIEEIPYRLVIYTLITLKCSAVSCVGLSAGNDIMSVTMGRAER